MKNIEKIEIALLYLILISGGLWHILETFQYLMRLFAAPILITLAVLLFLKMKKVNDKQTKSFYVWSAVVFLGGYLFELIGVITGLVFGEYQYGTIFQPQLFNVPIAMGFAWLAIQIGSLGLAQRLVGGKWNRYALAITTAVLMVCFDLVMEQAAIYLDYWSWAAGAPPLHNYLGWFGISLLFSMLGAKLDLLSKPLPTFVYHSYVAQFIYFAMIYIKKVGL